MSKSLVTMRSLPLFAITALAVAGCATAAEPPEAAGKAAERLAGYERTGKSVSCLGLASIRSIDALDDWRLLVHARNGDVYLNETKGRCSGAARPNTRIEYATSLSQLCRNQIIRIVDNGTNMMNGSCGLGDFERLEPAAAEAERAR